MDYDDDDYEVRQARLEDAAEARILRCNHGPECDCPEPEEDEPDDEFDDEWE